MIRQIIATTTAPTMRSPCFVVKSLLKKSFFMRAPFGDNCLGRHLFLYNDIMVEIFEN